MKMIAFDIETIPNERAPEYFEKVKKYKAPSNYKDLSKIMEYVKESREEDLNRAGLSWVTGEIIAICMHKILENKTVYFNTKIKSGSVKGAIYVKCKDEKDLLTKFMTTLSAQKEQIFLIGKNGVDFDIPFIKGRLMYHDLGLTDLLRGRMINDVDEIFSFSRSCSQRGSLDSYAWGLGLETKKFYGSQVYNLYKQDQHDDLASYCIHDVIITAEMIKRFYKQFEPNEKCTVPV